MKAKKHLLWLILPFLVLAISSCKKDSSSSPAPTPAPTPSVSVNDIIFDNNESEQIVTITLGTYQYFGADVDEDGDGWCFAEVFSDKGEGKIKITARPNNNTTPRSCRVNCWVSNIEDPDDEDKVELPIVVEQEAYKLEATEATFERFNFETNAHTDLIWDYDGGGHMEFGEMVYWWHRDWDEMYVTQTNDTLTFWARHTRENAQNGDFFYDHEYNLSIMITGFAEPFDNCEVNTVTYHHTWNGSNPDPNGYWQTAEGEDKVILAHIPLVDHNISLSNKTGILYFEYTNETMQVVEAYNLDHADTKDGHYQERNHQYVGSSSDIGLVEVHFKIR